MLAEERDQVDSSLLHQGFLPLPGSRDIASFVCRVVLLLVRGSTGPAIGVAKTHSAPPPGKFLVRLLLPAPRASPHERQHRKANRRSPKHRDRQSVKMESPRGVAQSGSALGWWPCGRRFKCCLPDTRVPDWTHASVFPLIG